MQRVVINMQSYLLGEAVEQALKNGGDFQVTVAEKPEETVAKCIALASNALLMEVAGKTPYTLAERLKIRDEVKQRNPMCKIVLLVDEKAETETADEVRQAKKDGIIDQFIYGSSSTSFLVALMDTL